MSQKTLEHIFSVRSSRLSQGIMNAHIRFCEARIAFDTVLIEESDSKDGSAFTSVKEQLVHTVRHIEDSMQALEETKIQFEYLEDTVPRYVFTDSELTLIGAMLISEGSVSILTMQKIFKALNGQKSGDMITYLESRAVALHEKMTILKKEFTKTQRRRVSSCLKNERELNVLVDFGRMMNAWRELHEMTLVMQIAYGSRIFGTMNFSRVFHP